MVMGEGGRKQVLSSEMKLTAITGVLETSPQKLIQPRLQGLVSSGFPPVPHASFYLINSCRLSLHLKRQNGDAVQDRGREAQGISNNSCQVSQCVKY